MWRNVRNGFWPLYAVAVVRNDSVDAQEEKNTTTTSLRILDYYLLLDHSGTRNTPMSVLFQQIKTNIQNIIDSRSNPYNSFCIQARIDRYSDFAEPCWWTCNSIVTTLLLHQPTTSYSQLFSVVTVIITMAWFFIYWWVACCYPVWRSGLAGGEVWGVSHHCATVLKLEALTLVLYLLALILVVR